MICIRCNKDFAPALRVKNKDKCLRCNRLDAIKRYQESEHGKAKGLAYRTAHKVEACKRTKEWYNENKDQYRETKRIYKKTSPVFKQFSSVWKKKRYWSDPEYYRIKALANKHKITPDLVKHLVGQPCNLCGSTEKITVDHMHPVSKGGKSVSNNLQPLCNTCNAFKNNRLFLPGGGMMI